MTTKFWLVRHAERNGTWYSLAPMKRHFVKKVEASTLGATKRLAKTLIEERPSDVWEIWNEAQTVQLASKWYKEPWH